MSWTAFAQFDRDEEYEIMKTLNMKQLDLIAFAEKVQDQEDDKVAMEKFMGDMRDLCKEPSVDDLMTKMKKTHLKHLHPIQRRAMKRGRSEPQSPPGIPRPMASDFKKIKINQ